MADGTAQTTFVWGDGEHTFRLRIKELRELKDKTGVGPMALYMRIGNDTWLVDDARETIRLGLIGGGMSPVDAHKLVKAYCEERPLLESLKPAQLILYAALMGPKDDPAGKAKAAKDASEAATTVSPSPPSTAPEQP